MSERPLRFERWMTPTEALMWSVEADPALQSSIMSVTFLATRPDVAMFRRRMARAVVLIPRLVQRVVPPPLGLGTPEWVDDPDFDLDRHVRHLEWPGPGPGTDRQLLDLAARLYSEDFDRRHPLWHFTVVEGLEGGRGALLGKLHHTISDGVGAVRLSALFIDLEPQPAEPLEPEPQPMPAPGSADATTAGRQPAGLGEAFGRVAGEALRGQLGLARRLVAGTVDAVTHPDRLVDDAGQAVTTARSLVRQLAPPERERSPLWAGRRSGDRHFEVLTVDLDAALGAGRALGGTLNDLFVTAVAAGAGAYHEAKGAPVAELRLSVPVSTRADRSAGGNAFTPARVVVPTGAMPPTERFRVVRERLLAAKSDPSLGLADTLASVAVALPPPLVLRFARSQVEGTDGAASNVRGAPFELYVGGALILSNHPIGPTGGTAFNATVLSYRSNLDLGLNVDLAAVDDPGLLVRCISTGLHDLMGLAG